MIKVRSVQNGVEYKVYLRSAYSKIKTTKQLIFKLDEAITRYENLKGWENYGKSLREKFEAGDYLEIMRLFGIINRKERID